VLQWYTLPEMEAENTIAMEETITCRYFSTPARVYIHDNKITGTSGILITGTSGILITGTSGILSNGFTVIKENNVFN
jgi:hypothetical protein